MEIREVLKHPRKTIYSLGMKGKLGFIPDEPYLKLMYWANTGKKLNIDNPRTFNEKLQWLKLHDYKPEYSTMVDKYEAKKWVASRIGEEYVIPTLGVWDSFEEIEFDKLPKQFVLKCTHDSGGLVICKDKYRLDLKKAKKKIEASLKRNYFVVGREYPYKNVKPRIIAEKYMEDNSSKDLKDYKFFCFGGQAKCFKVDFDRFIEHHANYYDENGSILYFGEVAYPPKFDANISLPNNIKLMERLAEQLSTSIPFLRADFYDVNGEVYFGELTLYPASGFGEFTDEAWSDQLGKWIKIPGGVLLIANNIVVVLNKKNDVILKEYECLTDYKFFCFNGEPKVVYVGKDKSDDPRTDFFDMDFNHLPIRMRDPNAEERPLKPVAFEQMKSLASRLSKGYRHLRVDFYLINGHIYVGELTFYHCSGFTEVKPEEWNATMGKWINFEEL